MSGIIIIRRYVEKKNKILNKKETSNKINQKGSGLGEGEGRQLTRPRTRSVTSRKSIFGGGGSGRGRFIIFHFSRIPCFFFFFLKMEN